MKKLRKIFIIWLALLVAEAGLFYILETGIQATLISILLGSVWLLIGIVAYFIFRNESSGATRAIFFNFSLFVVYYVAQIFYFLVGPGATFFVDSPYSAVYTFQYLQASNCFLMAFGILYIVIDALFVNFKVYQKYLVTAIIVGGVFVYYYNPFFSNPRFLYSTEDVADYRAVGQTVGTLESLGKYDPTAEEIAGATNLGVWKDGKQVGFLFAEQKVGRTSELMPYLEGDNYVPLVYKPLFLDNIYMNVLCIVFIFLFFGYQYKNDPPQGAYIEKIVFLFLPFCSLEVLHHFAYIKSVEASTLTDIMQIGQYLSLVSLLMITVFFVLRLRFITSVKGEFYERELVSDSEHISRWRDALDNLVVRHFLDPKAVHGRLFASRTTRNET